MYVDMRLLARKYVLLLLGIRACLNSQKLKMAAKEYKDHVMIMIENNIVYKILQISR